MAISSPRISRIWESESLNRSLPSKSISPLTILPGGAIRRMIESAVIDLPQPDSPTRPSSSPRSRWKLTPSTARTRPARVGKCVWRSIISRRCMQSLLESQLIHPRVFICTVFGRITQRLRNGSLLLCERPDDALACRKNPGLGQKHSISERFFSVNRYPSFRLVHCKQIVEEKSIQEIEMYQHGMLNQTADYASGQ